MKRNVIEEYEQHIEAAIHRKNKPLQKFEIYNELKTIMHEPSYAMMEQVIAKMRKEKVLTIERTGNRYLYGIAK